jgi:hypothetical protein
MFSAASSIASGKHLAGLPADSLPILTGFRGFCCPTVTGGWLAVREGEAPEQLALGR